MMYFSIEPEVAGGWGENTVFERVPGVGTTVHRLHYEFAGWLGDCLLTSDPCFIITEEAARAVERTGPTGFHFADVEVSTSAEFDEFEAALNPGRVLPHFVWLKVTGKPGADDFGYHPGSRLVVSERALTILRDLGISNALVEPVSEARPGLIARLLGRG